MQGSEEKRDTSGSPAEQRSVPHAQRKYPQEGQAGRPTGGLFNSVIASNDAQYISRPTRDNDDLTTTVRGKKGVSTVYRALWRYHTGTHTHFKHTAPTLGAVVRTLGLRFPANAAPPPRLRVIVRRRWSIEQRVFNANFVTTTATDVVGILRFGFWDWPWVSCHACDE